MRETLEFKRVFRERWQGLHLLDELCFSAIAENYEVRRIEKTLLYRARPWVGSQRSSYYIAIINNKIAWLRVANYWGGFFTDEGPYDECNTIATPVAHRWELVGGLRNVEGEYLRSSQAGYIYFEDFCC